MDDLLLGLVKTGPAYAFAVAFSWVLLRVVVDVLKHYQAVLDGVLGRVLDVLQTLEERTRACVDGK